MKIEFLLIGKTEAAYLKEGISLYEERLKHYTSYSKKEIPEIKNSSSLSKEQIKEKEGEQILKNLTETDELVLLDERGAQLTSEDFALRVERWSVRGIKKIVFAVGGAYGFSDAVYKRSNDKISLSRMTFSHQMVRVIFLEQLYRAFTIIKGEPYHHK
ncbi:MAG TPA: 23S rRNA (pseudouridine(1915)-N(3))-methyltransferase RlmH [Rikenellaceae bacterium]|nr:MAG: 23S rRNA (pseudouridine(1915)-N(3))-methyltransferase RlmH [Bacteroidetes bacterium GWE2_40_15]HBZ24897.1 23S rRNA (pseudouridine(1915)-N(3))-methyltransferase RlmH [Rikenellaceae bacterium]